MNDNSTTTTDPAAPAAVPAAAPAADSAPSTAAPAPSPVAPDAAAPASTPAAPVATDWRADAVTQVLGTAKDDEPADVKESREKLSKLAQKYTSPGEVLKALRAATVKLSDGSLRSSKPPKNATPEQVAEWRQQNGIPEAPDKYALQLPHGTVIGDEDKPYVDAILKNLHGADANAEVANAAVKTYLQIREMQTAALVERDKTDIAAAEDALRVAWGDDYRQNREGVLSMLSNAGSDVAEAILSARGPDGKALLNDERVARWLAQHARMLGFVGHTVVPAGGDIGAAIDDELALLKASMYLEDGRRNPKYWDNPKAQSRYRQLVEARDRRGG